jgi:hypothetical protein
MYIERGLIMSTIITELASLVTIVKTALTSLAGMWVVAVPAGFFVLGLAVKFLFGLMGRGKKRRR